MPLLLLWPACQAKDPTPRLLLDLLLLLLPVHPRQGLHGVLSLLLLQQEGGSQNCHLHHHDRTWQPHAPSLLLAG
jgi:hypothetical protein